MARKTTRIDPLRLCDAAEVAIRAVAEAQGAGAPMLYPPDLMGTAHQPSCLEGFTRAEIEEGCRFLIRMGMLKVRHVEEPLDSIDESPSAFEDSPD